MNAADGSVWIVFLNGRDAPHVRRLRALLGMEEIVVGDLMLCEVLQGLDSERAAREVETLLRRSMRERRQRTGTMEGSSA
ncbi:putative nucleic acid-binding protein [Bradyrhizobium sp. AZCC 1578]|uniref:hypothetical protein n=1 Tax=Bradyrhizobium sp. AZCC 1578 TaxID=3117027 RepID=UPI002FF130E3